MASIETDPMTHVVWSGVNVTHPARVCSFNAINVLLKNVLQARPQNGLQVMGISDRTER